MEKKPLPDVSVYPEVESLSLAAAELLSQVADRVIAERNRMLVALSGGSTPNRMFQVLASTPFAQSIIWEKIHIFWCDERLVPPDHLESNFGQAFQLLFKKVDIPAKNMHRIRGEEPPAQAVEGYLRELASFCECDLKWPRFDLAFLGLGADGHTTSLFPGVILPEEELSPIQAVTADYQGHPAGRVTLTPLALNSARNLVFLVNGRDKAHAVYQTLYGPRDLDKWLAQRIMPVAGKASSS
jgi:6-phosphogluconolactonase